MLHTLGLGYGEDGGHLMEYVESQRVSVHQLF